jgi:Ras-related protein Rab-18
MSVESSTSQNQPMNVKLLMLGHGSVGKSSLLLRCTDQNYLPEQEPKATIGVDTWVNAPVKLSTCWSHSVGSQSHKLDVKGKRVNLTIWVRPL